MTISTADSETLDNGDEVVFCSTEDTLDNGDEVVFCSTEDTLDNGDEVVFCSTEDTLDNGDVVVFCSIGISVLLCFEPGRIVCNGSCLDVDAKEVVFFCITGNKEEFLEFPVTFIEFHFVKDLLPS